MMETVIVTLKNPKAKKLLLDLEELDLIRIEENANIPKNASSFHVSDLKNMIRSPMSEEEINKQLAQLRDERERNF